MRRARTLIRPDMNLGRHPRLDRRIGAGERHDRLIPLDSLDATGNTFATQVGEHDQSGLPRLNAPQSRRVDVEHDLELRQMRRDLEEVAFIRRNRLAYVAVPG